jgi:hypothetical protein
MDPQHFDPSQLGLVFAFMGIMMMVVTVVMVIPYWFIFKKAGFSAWLSLLMFVPLANIIILYVVAFSDWKVVPVANMGYQVGPPQYPMAPPRV